MKMAWAWDGVLSLWFFCLLGPESHQDYELNSVKSTERFFAEQSTDKEGGKNKAE